MIVVWPSIPLMMIFLLSAATTRAFLTTASSSTARQQHHATTTRRMRATTKYEQLIRASTLSLAPMMEYTDRHFRHLVRLLSEETLVYTEMVAANAIAHERRDQLAAYRTKHPTTTHEQQAHQSYDPTYLRRFLGQSQNEGASVLQLGGSDPQQLYEAAETVGEFTDRGICDYTAINLNCGCPSPKVAGKGSFGAALMDEPGRVAELVHAIHEGCRGRMPVTVKCRIGTDTHRPFAKGAVVGDDHHDDEYRNLANFIETVARDGIVTDFGVHARIAVLQKSYSPADNRNIPPLKYHLVRRLVRDYPEFTFTLNGGIDSIPQVQAELSEEPNLAGVMVGRAWAADPWSFSVADQVLYGASAPKATNRWQVLRDFGKHADYEESVNDPVKIRRFITKAVSPLFAGEPQAKRFRIALDEIGKIPKRLAAEGKSLEGEPPISELILEAATRHLSEETLLRTPVESYERMLEQEERRKQKQTGKRPTAIDEWQKERKMQV